jgi:hypothetical protein
MNCVEYWLASFDVFEGLAEVPLFFVFAPGAAWGRRIRPVTGDAPGDGGVRPSAPADGGRSL